MCEQFAQSRYVIAKWLGDELTTSQLLVLCCNQGGYNTDIGLKTLAANLADDR